MNRRSFIAKGTLGGLAFPFAFTSCQQQVKGDSPGFPDEFVLNEITLEVLNSKLQSGEWTSRMITDWYLKRIAAIDGNGPALHAVIEVNPDALSEADYYDRERRAGKIHGPLHGIPVLIKDNIDTGDQMMTTAGSLALEGNVASNDAFIIAKLRKAGAVILGKTNLSEFANFRSSRSSSGWSSRGGQTKNPYILDRSPCGSSSGSGAAVAANLCAIAIGTETDGSIACPSSTNSIVGIKPTVGLWSRSGIIPISVSQDTAGPMARTVRDAAILLGCCTGVDPEDPVTGQSRGKSLTDYTPYLLADGLKGKRIGVEKSFLKGHERVDTLLQKALDQIKSLGSTLVEVELSAKVKDTGNKEYEVLMFEFKDGLNKYLSKSNSNVKSLQQIIDFNKKNEAKVMPFFKQEILEGAQAKGDLQTKEYLEAHDKVQNGTQHAIDGLLKERQLDAICGPANGPSWCIDLVNGDFFTGYGAYSPAAMAGYPSITVPLGFVNELPVGISFFGAAFSEPGLISIAYAYEQASKNRRPPTFRKSILS